MIPVFYTSGDKHGWAIDEDLRHLREALAGTVQETSLGAAEVIHSPYWRMLEHHPADLLRERFIIANADNPPYFYLKESEFALGQQHVDLWIARSHEAYRQFESLGLAVEYVPYAVDTKIFYPMSPSERLAMREKYGIPENAYVIANFHRDTEGGDLRIPKAQKAPELMMQVLLDLRAAGQSFHVLLAGPRRHWLRRRLREEGIAFTYVGKELETDDFGVNILSRPTLNELYAASDLYLIPSRWEGGPQSVMEAAACRCKTLSSPVGLAWDILESRCLFRTAAQAAQIISEDIEHDVLSDTLEPQFARARDNHDVSVLPGHYRRIYGSLPQRPAFQRKRALFRNTLRARWRQGVYVLESRFARAKKITSVAIDHQAGHAEWDRIMEVLREAMRTAGIMEDSQSSVVFAGRSNASSKYRHAIQLVPPDVERNEIISDQAILIASSVQDVVNLRSSGIRNPSVALPFVPKSSATLDFEPLVVAEEDLMASSKVWTALAQSIPVFYPAESAYGEQVFHAGLPYSDRAEGGAALLEGDRKKFQEVIWMPSPASSLGALLRLASALEKSA
jgi:glycosyltransferase involved in cell wall biosynthesis